MQLTKLNLISSFFLLLLSPSSVFAAPAAAYVVDLEGREASPTPPPLENFKLRVWQRRYMDTPPPYIDGQLEIGFHGHGLYNKTKGYTGFPAALTPGPRQGKLIVRGTGKYGYLQPIPSTTLPARSSDLFQLKFAKRIPKHIPGILYKNFTKQGRDCGGMCGGIDLRYGSEYGDPSSFYLVPHKTAAGVWLVQYTHNTAKAPAGAAIVILWPDRV